MPNALFARADFDVMTKYLSAYMGKLIDFAGQNGYAVTDLYDDKDPPARLMAFEAEMDKKPDIFIGGGHGGTNVFTGQDQEVLIKQGVNDDIASGVKTYLWSCLTAQQLGRSMVETSCPVYYGYREEFTIIVHVSPVTKKPDYTSNPLDDPYARGFMDAGLATGYAMLLGKTVEEVYQATIDRYNYWYDYWLTGDGKDDDYADEILQWLNWDRTNFVAITKQETYQVERLNLQSLALPIGVGVALLLLSRLG